MTIRRVTAAFTVAASLLLASAIASPASALSSIDDDVGGGLPGDDHDFPDDPGPDDDGDPWTSAPWAEMRFVVEAVGFVAIDETERDWLGSDEVATIFQAANGDLSAPNDFGNVDSGDRRFYRRNQSCITPVLNPNPSYNRGSWRCDPEGQAGPIDISVSMWETDSIGFNPLLCDFSPSPSPGCHDDLIGKSNFTRTSTQLARLMPRVGDQHVETFQWGGSWTHYEYQFTLRITRVADHVLAPVLER